MDLEKYSPLIGAIYDAALNETNWRGLAPLVATAFDAESCAIQVRSKDATDLLSVTDNFTPKLIEDYVAEYYRFDEWAVRATHRRDSVWLGHELIATKELLSSAICDFLRGADVYQLVGGVLTVDAAQVGVIGVHRKSGDFDELSRRKMELLYPHLRRAMQIRSRLKGVNHERRLALDAVDAVGVGIMAVSADGRLLLANRRAEQVLRGRYGLAVSHGHLRATDRAKNERLGVLIRQAAGAVLGDVRGSGGVLALPREDGFKTSLLVAPLPPHDGAGMAEQPMALIVVGDSSEGPRPAAKVLADLYGLTPAEAQLTAALLAGEQLNAYAARHGISRETARTLLKRIFDKTGCSRQVDLIRELLANPVLQIG